MENALPVVPQDWRALWKIKTTNSSRSTQLTSSGSPLPPSSGKPATPEEAEATVEPVKMSKAARKRANRNARMAAIANTATCTAPSAVIANCPSLSPLQDMKIPSDKPEPPADPGDSASGSPRQNNKRPLSRYNTAEERANKRIFLGNLPLEIPMNEVKAIVPEVVDLKLIPKPAQGEG
ncbi:hypothetical protein RvY_06072-3 [Ramazzottius varieornatus]|uniref:Uncharacterized protein n=1 Tax=Ramazzottius varieornatus TaxID=947166 RepID=A0A1D1V0U0_RAMVA|nr:hypothetical protein RvY_06072-3 [Ramazzottius varieornatus]